MSGGGNMDIFLQLLSTTDPKKKLSIGNDIINFLSNPENSIECSDIGQFIDGLVPWIQSSNSKVAQNGLDILTFVVDRMDSDFRPYLSTVLPATIDRLGDGKDTVREKAQVLIMKFMDKVVTPQQVFEKLSPGFSHKNGKVREEVMLCLRTTLNEHGAQSLSISRLVPAIVKLLSDPMSTVRDTAFNTLVEIYRHVGERLRSDLQKKHNVPASKLPGLMSKFDEVRDSGDVLPTALQNSLVDGGRGDDETDRIANSAKRASSVPAPRRAIYTSNKPPPQSSAGSKVRRTSSLRRTSSAQSGQAGAVDEETFIRSFEDVPTIQLFSAKELEEQLVSIRETIADPNKDWAKRVESLKRLRALLLAGASNFDELYVHLRLLEPPFQISVKDLRSQVVREACITIAYLSQQLGHKCDRFTESLFPGLIYLIQSSAKVMATAGIVAIRFIIQNTHSPRLIPIIASNMSSKSKDIRRACCEFLDQLLHTWPTHTLERHIALLQDAIRKGIADADPEARASSRKAFWGFADHFRDQADSLLNSLDGSYKRLLHGELSLSNSSSSNSLNTTGSGRGTTPRSRASSTTDGHGGGSPRHSPALRSNSAIDLQAAQRAKARAQYAAAARMKVGSGASLRDEHGHARPRKSSDAGMSVSAITSPERVGRTRTRVSGVSQSQPSSRSGSPSSRLSYATYSAAGGDSNTVGRPRRLSGIPRSTGTSREASRETSPNRFASHDRSFGSKLRGRSLLGMTQSERPPQPARPVMAQKILQQSREAESALADALNFDNFDDFQRTPNRKAYRPFDDHSDDSETSSVCSERSFDSYRRPSDPYSWSGSQQRLYRDLWEPLNKDISEIITNCASTHWSDRKEGLVGLQNYFQTGNALTGSELKRVTEIFTKMFMDAHTKVFSLFLDTLNELIITHKADLQDWLYVLLTRLLNKLGADLLGSIQNKIHKSLDVVRDSFPCDQQFNVIVRFLVDQTQTPNSKVKVAVLSYLTQLTAQMEPMHFSSGKDTRMALSKIIGWTSDKSVEIRKAAHNTVIALFNLNTPEVTMLLSQLPKEYQEAAAALVQNHLRRSSTEGSPPSPLVSSPRLQSPGTPQPKSGRSSRSNTLDLDDENLNPEEVYRSLRRTTAEIQNYSFESLDRCGKLDRDRDTTSQDSGISQMSAGAGDKLDTLEERLEDCGSLNNSGSGRSSSLSSPIHRIPGCLREFNGLDKSGIGENPFEGENGYISRESHHHDDSEAIKKILEILNGDATDGRIAERKNALTQLIRLVREGSTLAVIDHFKVLLRVLLEQLTSPEGGVRALVLGVLMEMFKKRSMTACFQSYIELLILKVLQAHKDGDKDVVRAAEACAATMGSVLPADVVIRVLNPLIKTGDFPVNQAAIKMLTRLIEQKDKEAIEPHLTDLMPGLLKAYDNEESSVRKSAVFCMVALHSVVGEEDMTPHLKPLNGSKMKLLHLYIKRSKQSSEPASPKSTPPE